MDENNYDDEGQQIGKFIKHLSFKHRIDCWATGYDCTDTAKIVFCRIKMLTDVRDLRWERT